MAQNENGDAPETEAEEGATAPAPAAAGGDENGTIEEDPQPETPEQRLERLRGELAVAEATAAAAEDRALRAAAEAENTRRRAERSIENAHKYALERFVGDLLPAVDSFERAADAAGADGESGAAGENAVAAMAEGVALSLKLLLGAMEKQGIAVVDPIGAPFDPKLHEAMSMIEKAEAEPGSVVEVFQKGYTVNGRLARPARVIVAKAPAPDAGDATDADAAPGSDAKDGA